MTMLEIMSVEVTSSVNSLHSPNETIDEEFDEEQIAVVRLCRAGETAKYTAWSSQ